jgi:hypothetical protein
MKRLLVPSLALVLLIAGCETQPATDIDHDSAFMNAYGSTAAADGNYRFQWCTNSAFTGCTSSSNYVPSKAGVDIAKGDYYTRFGNNLTGLSAGTTYYFRLQTKADTQST